QDIVFRLIITIGLFLIYNSLYSQNKRALMIGISDYQLINNTANSWENIHGANDVAILSPTLQQHGFKVASIVNQQATAANIRKQLSKLSSSCKPGDIVYLHFSCHGQPVEDLDGDETDGWDEAIVPVDAQKFYIKDKYEGENHIIDDELNRFFRTIRSKIGRNGYLTVVVDACHAGTSFRGEENEDSVFVRGTNTGFSGRGKKFVPKIDKRGQITIQQSPDMSDICIIEACRSYQVNSEIKVNNQYYGSLSYYLNKVLKSNDIIIWQEPWYNDVLALMARDSRLIRQNPVIEISK
ncbi:MAG: caspase family protein, partial [Muribaculaceae bacterium]|nr:caspase family protein [Muribaculaceae bacterium]